MNDNDEYVLAAFRVEDFPEPYIPAEKKPCGECEKDVWVAKDQIQQLPDDVDGYDRILCVQCLRREQRKRASTGYGLAG